VGHSRQGVPRRPPPTDRASAVASTTDERQQPTSTQGRRLRLLPVPAAPPPAAVAKLNADACRRRRRGALFPLRPTVLAARDTRLPGRPVLSGPTGGETGAARSSRSHPSPRRRRDASPVHPSTVDDNYAFNLASAPAPASTAIRDVVVRHHAKNNRRPPVSGIYGRLSVGFMMSRSERTDGRTDRRCHSATSR